MENGREIVWNATYLTCLWTVEHRQREAAHTAGVEHQTTYPEHPVPVDWCLIGVLRWRVHHLWRSVRRR